MITKLFRSRIFLGAACFGVLLAGYAAFDLYAPRTSDIRSFDPNEVARLETAMWRSYYGKHRFRLFRELAEVMRTQYRLPYLRSYTTAYHAARAAFVFKEGKSREEYERALPYIVDYYENLRDVSSTPFDVQAVSRIELEWWIVHRERANHDPDDLVQLLAELPARIYNLPRERFLDHARMRAEAMRIRDTKADTEGGVTEADWERIDELLHESWRSLYAEVRG